MIQTAALSTDPPAKLHAKPIDAPASRQNNEPTTRLYMIPTKSTTTTHLVQKDALAVVLALLLHAVGRVAERALVAGHAAAGEVVAGPAVDEVAAARAVPAGLVGAGYELEVLAALAVVLVRADATVRALQVLADAVVLTGTQRDALVHVLLASVCSAQKFLLSPAAIDAADDDVLFRCDEYECEIR